jgi:LDH2 family malate/lactate/ureidoglycolate dehydrogenase
MGTTERYRADALTTFATTLLTRAGLPDEKARAVAEILVEADLLGHTTHGLDMLARYLREIETGAMVRDGDPETLRDHGAALVWDGRRLPGPWLTKRAIAVARERLKAHPTVTVVVRRSHHIGCLQAYLQPVAADGFVILLTCSDPSGAGVTPHGGIASRITPNPMAAGFPTDGAPVLMDVSMSTTTNALTKRLHETGGRLPGPWIVDADGEPTDDPSALFAAPPGAILPLGGLDLGHKGFALALLVEALTSGLAGHGRADGPKEWGASVFLQLIDPQAFGGREAFRRETEKLAAICRETPVAPGAPPVRLPGERALRRRADQLRGGVELFPTVFPALRPWAERLGVALPAPISA